MSKKTSEPAADGVEYPADFFDGTQQEQPQQQPPPETKPTEPKQQKAQQPLVASAKAVSKSAVTRKDVTSTTTAFDALRYSLGELKLDSRRVEIELGFAAQAIHKNDYLKKADAKSIFDSVVFAARIGLTLNPALGFCYLVPRYNKKLNNGNGAYECNLDIGYKGWVAKLRTSKAVADINAFIVYDDEVFEWNPASGTLIHYPKFAASEAEHKARKVVAAYTSVLLPNGARSYEVIPAWELNKIEKTSPASAGFTPYKTWEDEMRKKAPIKRHAKKLLSLDTMQDIADMFDNENNDEQIGKNNRVKARWDDSEFTPSTVIEDGTE